MRTTKDGQAIIREYPGSEVVEVAQKIATLLADNHFPMSAVTVGGLMVLVEMLKQHFEKEGIGFELAVGPANVAAMKADVVDEDAQLEMLKRIPLDKLPKA